MNEAQSNAGSLGAISEMSAQREKYWEEKDADQKIDVLRDEVARLCLVVAQQAEIIVKLNAHQHGADGRLMIPLVDGVNRIGLFAHDNGIPHRLRTKHERR